MTNRINWDLSEPCFRKRLDHCDKRSCQPLVELLAGEVPAWPLPGAGCGTLFAASGSVALAGVCLGSAGPGPAIENEMSVCAQHGQQVTHGGSPGDCDVDDARCGPVAAVASNAGSCKQKA